jgi:hypothetical protein
MPKYALECTGVRLKFFQNAFERACDEIRLGDTEQKIS